MYQHGCRWTAGVIILLMILSIAACQQAEEKKAVAAAPLQEFLQEISASTPAPTAMKEGETVTISVMLKNISKETWPAQFRIRRGI